MPDLNLLVAEKLSQWNLPASLAPSILSYLVLDFSEEAQPMFDEDWHTLARHALTYPSERIEDFVSSLAANGPLIVATDGAEEVSRP